MKSFIIIFQLILLLPAAVVAEPFKIGMLLPLTGPVAPFGVALRNSIELAQSENEEVAARTIQFVYEDSNYTGKVAVSAFNKLIQSENVDLVFVWGTPPAVAVAPIAEKIKFPLIVLSGEATVAGHRDYVIDFTGRISDYSRATLDYARKKGFKKIAATHIETQYAETLLQGMEEYRREGESIERIGSFSPDGISDFNTVLNKVQVAASNKRFDALALFLGTGQISLFYQKMQQRNIRIPTIGSDYFSDQEEMRRAGALAAGSFYATQKTSDGFLQKYVARYHVTTGIPYAANIYDFATLSYKLFGNPSAKLPAKDILSRFEISTPILGATGEFYFLKEDPTKYKDPGKRFVFPVIIKEVQTDGSSKEV